MLNIAFEHGQAAFSMGFDANHNPYSGASREVWLNGWKAAARAHSDGLGTCFELEQGEESGSGGSRFHDEPSRVRRARLKIAR